MCVRMCVGGGASVCSNGLRALSFSHSHPPTHTHTHALAPTLSWMGGWKEAHVLRNGGASRWRRASMGRFCPRRCCDNQKGWRRGRDSDG